MSATRPPDMRVALVNTLYAPYQVGGAERAVQILAEGLSRRGHSVSVITLGEPGLEPCSVVNGVTVYRLALQNWYWPFSGPVRNAAQRAAWHVRDFHNAAMSARAGRVLDAVSPDVVHTNNLAGFSVGLWAQAARRGVPLVHTLHDYYLMCPPSAMYRNGANCERICPRCLPFAAHRRGASQAVQAVAGVSQYILERHTRAGFFRAIRPAKVIFNTVGAAQGKDRAARKGPLTFGFIGRICEEKGVRRLLEVFARHARPHEKLVLAGKGEPGFVASLKAEFGSPSVAFIGHVDPAVFYERVDVVVIPSLWHEPFGRTAIEALAYRIPVIASSRGGIPEVIQDGVTGLIVDPDEPGALASAMRRLSEAPELAGRLGANGAERLSRFSEQSALDAYESVYAELGRSPELLQAGAK